MGQVLLHNVSCAVITACKATQQLAAAVVTPRDRLAFELVTAECVPGRGCDIFLAKGTGFWDVIQRGQAKAKTGHDGGAEVSVDGGGGGGLHPSVGGLLPARGWFDTVQTVRYLGVHFDPGRGWRHHFVLKRAAAILLRLGLRRAGLFGGKNFPADSLKVARSKLWATIDSGRGTASSQGPGCKAIAALDSFHLETLREIVGVSRNSRKRGVRGETGELPDVWRKRKKNY